MVRYIGVMLVIHNTTGNDIVYTKTPHYYRWSLSRDTFFLSRTTILPTVHHIWQCISWLYIGSTKEFHVKG